VASNSSAQGRAQNRRIEILLTPVLKGAQKVAAAKAPVKTASAAPAAKKAPVAKAAPAKRKAR
jgi:hypothetical protein